MERRRQLSVVWFVGTAMIIAAFVWFFLFTRDDDRRAGQSGAGASATATTDAGSGSNARAAALPAPRPAAVPSAATDGGADGGASANVLARLGWGSGPNQLGRDRPQEGNPEGPMSLALDASGRAHLLDQVNGRIVRLDENGNPSSTLALTVRMAQDLTVTADGTTVVLDRLADKSVAIMGPDGKLVGELPVEGSGIEEGGGVTGVFVDGEDVYVEREHGSLVRLGDLSGKPDPQRGEIPGRPSRDGRLYLNAGIIVPQDGRVYVNAIDRATLQHLYTREFRLGAPVVGILALDTDRQGTIYFANLVEVPQPSASAQGGREPAYVIRLLCLNPADGTPLGQTELPASSLPEESFRDFAVADEGGVVYAYKTEEGVTYLRADCR